MRLATWNINSLAVRLPQVLDWLAAHPVDVLALQETKLADERFPRAELEAAGYAIQHFGQKTYNGVALITRRPAVDVLRNIPGHDDLQARLIAATLPGSDGSDDALRVVSVYVPNGQAVGSDKFGYKLRWLAALQAWLRAELAAHPRLVVMGDYNIAPEEPDVHDPAAWDGQVLFTPQERGHFRELLGLGLHDAFRLFEQPPRSFSWWDYRMLAFRRNAGLRIDHILASEALRTRVLACAIDRAPRRLERPSDHAPVVMELA